MNNVRSFLIAASIVAAAAAQAQSFFNAGFETPNVGVGGWAPRPAGWGWDGQYNTGIANGNGSWGTGPHSGQQYAYFESDVIDFPGKQAYMDQSVSGFTIGQQYDITFWMATRNGNV